MHALRVLEFPAIVARLQLHCETPHGAEQAGEILPQFNPDRVWQLLRTTAEAHDALGRHSVPSLRSVKDIRGPLMRAQRGGLLGGTELVTVGETMQGIRIFRQFLAPLSENLPNLAAYADALPDERRVEEQLLDSLEPDGVLRDGASVQLSAIRQRKKSASARIVDRIQAYISGRTRELLSDPIYTVRDGRYVIPLKSENRGKIRGIIHDTSSSGQTIFLEPADVVELGNALREVEADERTEELRILTMLSEKVGSVAPQIAGGVEAAGHLDIHFAKARLGFEMRGSMPNRVEGKAYIKIQGGRHPLLDPEIAVPLDLEVGKGSSVLITGPNTGGKTVSIKTVGLYVAMAQSGMMPPALDVRLGTFSQIWADIGDEQSLQQSLSTFSGHLKNISAALTGLKEGALVLLDEVGAGTDPAEGAALAIAILQDMADRGAAVLASTHYGELKAFALNTPGFSNAAMEFDPKSLRPTYRLIMGAPGASHALRIAERYGIPTPIIERAREGLGEQAQDLARMMERLEQSQRQARIAQGEADRRLHELRQAESRASRKLAEADDIRKNANAKANEVIELALREIRLEASKLFEELKQSPNDPKVQERIRRGLKDLDAVGRDFAQEFVPKSPRTGSSAGISKGGLVKIEGFGQTGTVLEEPKDGKVAVQVGPLKMTFAVHQLRPMEKSPGTIAKPKANVQLQKAISASTEVMLINKRAEEALRELERAFDDAMLSGMPSLRIVHGKGEGILRKVTHDFLKEHAGVVKFRDGEPAEGGQGVTMAMFQ